MADSDFVLSPEEASAVRACVEVGAEGLGETRDAVLSLVKHGTNPEGQAAMMWPDALLSIPEGLLQDVRSAFIVGWEGLEPADVNFDAAEQAARILGITTPSLAP